jgi:hypothetical protein
LVLTGLEFTEAWIKIIPLNRIHEMCGACLRAFSKFLKGYDDNVEFYSGEV